MAIAKTIKSYLEQRGVDYQLIEHAPSSTLLEAAHSAQVPGDQVAKAVVLEDKDGYVVAVVPSTNRLDFRWIAQSLDRPLELAEEFELPDLFKDCELGAVPALGEAYGLEVIWDDQLKGHSDIYIEAGDHEHLIHIVGKEFARLMSEMPHSVISAERDYSDLRGH